MSSDHARTRRSAGAGRFFPGDPRQCATEATRFCAPHVDLLLPDILYGALVPHAGWAYSGRIAGSTIAALAQHTEARTIVLTGAMHTSDLDWPALDSAGAWASPLGPVAIDETLRDAILQLDDFMCLDQAHELEHSLDVQLPLLQTAFGDRLRIVPCVIPLRRDAARWGRSLGALLAAWREPVAVIASSDLTHYGPSYRFTPHGGGKAGYRWAHQVNDRELLDLIERMAEEDVTAHASKHHSACGAGAIAVMLAACRSLGAGRGYLLEQTDSARELASEGRRDVRDSVGYAGAVFG
ncbi:MAG: AmmeMemoRadiSam system protein B [Phycisphaerales bacterium]|nr:AmmeMemoRadiSam system protein B [Phycisphaerales bacterium]